MAYFREDEFLCSCGCGMDIDSRLKRIITRAREIANVPFVITSGARCEAYNDSIEKASKSSSHVKGLAVDIQTKNSRSRFTILSALYDAGIVRIGISKSFIHADIDLSKVREVVWTYS